MDMSFEGTLFNPAHPVSGPPAGREGKPDDFLSLHPRGGVCQEKASPLDQKE